MPKHSISGLDHLFAALSDPTRRDVVARLAEAGEATVSTLASAYAMAPPSFTQHLQVLEQAGLIDRTKVGRQRHVTLRLDGLAPAREWLDAVAPQALAGLAALPPRVDGPAVLAKAQELHAALAGSMAIVELASAPPQPATFSPAAHAARRLRALTSYEPGLAAELASALALYRELGTQLAAVRQGGPVELLREATLPLGRFQFQWRQHPILRELLANPSGQAA